MPTNQHDKPRDQSGQQQYSTGPTPLCMIPSEHRDDQNSEIGKMQTEERFPRLQNLRKFHYHRQQGKDHQASQKIPCSMAIEGTRQFQQASIMTGTT